MKTEKVKCKFVLRSLFGILTGKIKQKMKQTQPTRLCSAESSDFNWLLMWFGQGQIKVDKYQGVNNFIHFGDHHLSSYLKEIDTPKKFVATAAQHFLSSPPCNLFPSHG